MKRAIVAAIAIAIALIAIPFACTLESGNSDLSSSEASSLATPASPGDDIAPAATNCSRVNHCTPGTQCKQLGCTLSAAAAECRAETPIVCGKASLPWTIIDSSGVEHSISDSCRLSGCPSTTRSGCRCDHQCIHDDVHGCCFDGPCT
jgi:hypothetical protein